MSVAQHEVYYNHYQLPVFCVLLVVLWGLIVIRLWSIRVSDGWRTWKAAGALLVVLTGMLCTSYVGLLVASYVLNKRITDVRGPLREPGDVIVPDPSTYPEKKITMIYATSLVIIRILVAERYVLTFSLWTTKAAFVTIFLDARDCLGKGSRWLLHCTTVFVLATYVLSIWALVDYFHKPESTAISREDARNGNLELGLRFEGLDLMNELVLTAGNIVTDMLLAALACRVIRSLRVSLSAICLPLSMVTITISVAIARLVMVVLSSNLQGYTEYLTIPFQFLSEAESFLACCVSCFPGMRVWIRTRLGIVPTRTSGTVDSAALSVMDSYRSSKGFDFTQGRDRDSQGTVRTDADADDCAISSVRWGSGRAGSGKARGDGEALQEWKGIA